jgi:alpha-1,3-rhamnosyltransferase
MQTRQLSGPLVSVVIPCYNHSTYVQESIRSVIDQDYENIELIIIDDGSKDDSVEKIRELLELCENRFARFEFRWRGNKGLSATLNEAIEWCSGEYYSAIASDDVMALNKTSVQVDYLIKNSECVAVFGGVQVLNTKNTIGYIDNNKNIKKYDFAKIFLHKHNLPAPTQMIRLEAIKKVGGYRNDIVIEDWYMWLMLSSIGGRLDKLACVLAKYRQHEGNFSRQFLAMEKGREKILDLFSTHRMFRRAKANSLIMAAIYFQRTDRKRSFSLFISSLHWNAGEIFQSRVAKFIIKAAMPHRIFKRYLKSD